MVSDVKLKADVFDVKKAVLAAKASVLNVVFILFFLWELCDVVLSECRSPSTADFERGCRDGR